MNWYQANDCLGGASSQAFVAGVMNHEGYGSTGTNGHQSFYESEAGQTAYDPMTAVEKLVEMSPSALADAVRDEVNNRSNTLKAAVEAKGEPSGNFPSAVRWLWVIALHYWQLDLFLPG
jgi:hypothetical protein